MIISNQSMATNPYSRPTINYMEKNKCTIKNFIMIETHGDYKDIYSRSISINADNNAINGLRNLLNKDNHITDITSMEISNYVNGTASLSSVPSFKANIPNGWQTKRYRFMLAVSCFDGISEDISYIQGFSEYADPSISGHVDPNMHFYINSITSVMKVYDPNTGRYFVRPKRSVNIISDMANGHRYEEIESPNSLKLIRPVDVMNKIHVLNQMEDNFNVIDTTGTLQNTTVSARNNADPSNYLAKTLNGFLEAKSSIMNTADTVSLYRNSLSSAFIREGKLVDDIFIKQLYNITNIINPTSFTLNILKMMDPDVEFKGKIISRNPLFGAEAYGTLGRETDVAETYDASVETLKAATVFHSMNSMLIDNMITKLSVSFSNESGPIPVIIVTDINTFIESPDLMALDNKIKQHNRSVLMPILTDNSYTAVNVVFETDLLGDTNISISVNHGPAIIYRYPAFADSLFSPVISTKDNMSVLVEDVQNLMDATYLE